MFVVLFRISQILKKNKSKLPLNVQKWAEIISFPVLSQLQWRLTVLVQGCETRTVVHQVLHNDQVVSHPFWVVYPSFYG